jgi:hypothetical protein
MGSAKLAGVALWLLTLTHLMQMVLGWAFQVPPRIVGKLEILLQHQNCHGPTFLSFTEGANAEFQVVDDGGGFYVSQS